VIYNPARTRLMQQAEAAGLKTAGGLAMLVHQAAASARRFLREEIEERRVGETLSWLARRPLHRAHRHAGLGKSTGRAQSRKAGAAALRIDQMIERSTGRSRRSSRESGERAFASWRPKRFGRRRSTAAR
jgi:hypothetical protein